MDKREFDETWPIGQEGSGFSDQERITEMQRRFSKGRTFRSWAIGIIGWAAFFAAFSSENPATLGAIMASLAFIYLAHLSSTLQTEIKDLRIQVETLRGSIRNNRFVTIRHIDELDGSRESLQKAKNPL